MSNDKNHLIEELQTLQAELKSMAGTFVEKVGDFFDGTLLEEIQAAQKEIAEMTPEEIAFEEMMDAEAKKLQEREEKERQEKEQEEMVANMTSTTLDPRIELQISIREWLDENLSPSTHIDEIIADLLEKHPDFSREYILQEIRDVANSQGFVINGLSQTTQSLQIPEDKFDFSELAKIKFKWGPTEWKIDLPKELKFHLPRDMFNSTFSMDFKATAKGKFSLSLNLHGNHYADFALITTYDVNKKALTVGTEFKTIKVYTGPKPQEIRDEIMAKGEKLKSAISNWSAETGTLDQLTEISEAISGIYSSANKLKSKTKEAFAVVIGTQTYISFKDNPDLPTNTQFFIRVNF